MHICQDNNYFLPAWRIKHRDIFSIRTVCMPNSSGFWGTSKIMMKSVLMSSLCNALQIENIAPLDIYVHHLKSSVVINVAIAREVWATSWLLLFATIFFTVVNQWKYSNSKLVCYSMYLEVAEYHTMHNSFNRQGIQTTIAGIVGENAKWLASSWDVLGPWLWVFGWYTRQWALAQPRWQGFRNVDFMVQTKW